MSTKNDLLPSFLSQHRFSVSLSFSLERPPQQSAHNLLAPWGLSDRDLASAGYRIAMQEPRRSTLEHAFQELEAAPIVHTSPLTAPLFLCFNWNDVFEKYGFTEATDLYVVAFRSVCRRGSDEEAINRINATALDEAGKSGGLLRTCSGAGLGAAVECSSAVHGIRQRRCAAIIRPFGMWGADFRSTTASARIFPLSLVRVRSPIRKTGCRTRLNTLLKAPIAAHGPRESPIRFHARPAKHFESSWFVEGGAV